MIKQYDIIRNASPPCTVYIIRDGARIANSNWHHFWVCSIELLSLLQQAGADCFIELLILEILQLNTPSPKLLLLRLP